MQFISKLKFRTLTFLLALAIIISISSTFVAADT